jgi:hypothetical protein
MTNTSAAGASPEPGVLAGRVGMELEKPAGGALESPQGSTSIADIVVQKIAGLAAREINGVHRLVSASPAPPPASGRAFRWRSASGRRRSTSR